MQEGINIQARRVCMRDCTVPDLMDYCVLKCMNIPKSKRKAQISQREGELLKELTDFNGNLALVAILDERRHVIGLIKMYCLDSETSISLDISIPEELKMYGYGAEALHQFIKAMGERFERIEINPENRIVSKYIQERGVIPPVVLKEQ